MEIIKNKIVFSNDIERILNGNNAISFNYSQKGIIKPSTQFIEGLRRDFQSTVNKIFENQTFIIQENQMLESIYYSIRDFYGRYPHHIFR